MAKRHRRKRPQRRSLRNPPDALVLQTLIDFAEPRGDGATRLRVAFGAPSRVLVARTAEEVKPVLEAVQALSREGRWCVGCLRYEAAAAFDPAFAVHAGEEPLAWFGVHDAAVPWPDATAGPVPPVDWQAGLSRAGFDRNIEAIHRAIANGELYQLNYTAPLRAEFRGDARDWFMALRKAQPNGYAAFIDTGDEQVLSVSPELFFDWQDERILARPMKGTAPRGATTAEDEAMALRLRTVPKERAENVMIVDLIRNDLSRVAQPFSVRVPRLFHTEALPTVWQMTSDVEAKVRDGVSLVDVFSALFPCGSITGAPKVGAMRMIRALEPEARGVYCGAVGVVRPGGHATFNVPIRTVTLRGTQARCGIGSGITADAQADAEWDEWRHKRAFLGQGPSPVSSAAMDSFELLETLALVDGALRDAPAHLARMQKAAAHFGHAWSEAAATACLASTGRRASDGYLARSPPARCTGAAPRGGLRHGRPAATRAIAIGLPRLRRGRRRVLPLQDHAPRALRGLRAHRAGRVRHPAVESPRRDHRMHARQHRPAARWPLGHAAAALRTARRHRPRQAPWQRPACRSRRAGGRSAPRAGPGLRQQPARLARRRSCAPAKIVRQSA
jgi:para-aminobenzoate synthetase/4-amino-4-deoxychorismate lyase